MNSSFQVCVSNGCHDFLQKAMSLKDIVNVSVNESSYRIHF